MADDAAFQEAVEALRAGNKTKARELITDLLKTDQSNTTYWIWLSAAMDSTKERIYCLQTALKLDPENATAKRGLILLGALPADESVQPFPMNRPRAWEEKLLLAHEKPKPKGWAAVRQSPVFRLGLVILLVGGLIVGLVFGLIIPSTLRAQQVATVTPGPSPTFTLSPTPLGGKPQPSGTPDPLLAEFNVQSAPTATALYVEVKRSPVTADDTISFQRAFSTGKWDDAVKSLKNIIQNDSTQTWAYYYLGEVYLQQNDPGNALDAYNQGVQKASDFGPMYVGLARARLALDPNANVLSLLDQAIQLDPNFGLAYLERGIVKTRDNDIAGAIKDLGDANSRLPNSPVVYFNLAQAYVKQGNLDLAIKAAQRAQQYDVTYLPNYLLLGQIYAQQNNNAEAVKALQIYLKFKPDDVSANLLFGKILFDEGKYDLTIQLMDRITSLDRTRREAYLYRFLSNVELGNGSGADADIDSIIRLYPDSFDANLGILRTHYLNERYGSAEQSVPKTEKLAETDQQKALIYYWAALVYEKRNNNKKAADYWHLLSALPEDAMTADMRKTAEEHLAKIFTPTPSPIPTDTRQPTATKKVTPTKTPTRTSTPTKTLTPTPTS
jgi:tetratricopeptide (TPR) repeat protein